MPLAIVICAGLLLGIMLWTGTRSPKHQHSWVLKVDHPPYRSECDCGAVKLQSIQPPPDWIGWTDNRQYECPQCGDTKPRSWKLCASCGGFQG